MNAALVTPEEVRRLYIEYRRVTADDQFYSPGVRWDGGVDGRTGHKHVPCWPLLADNFNNNRISPIGYFAYLKSRAGQIKCLWPNQIFSAKILQGYSEYVFSRPESIRRELQFGLRSIECQASILQNTMSWDRKRAFRYAVADEQSVDASDLVRLVFAMKYGFQDVVDFLWNRVILVYLSDKELYDVNWGEWIPSQLRQCVSGVRG